MKRFLILTAGALLIAIHVNSQNHQGLDPSFGHSGLAFIKFQNKSTTGLSMALQLDGKVICGGGNINGAVIARYNSNGSPDESFGSFGVIDIPSLEAVNNIIVQPDGKILIAGCQIMRLMPDGTVDHSFGNMGQFMPPDCANQMALQPDGKILVASSTPSTFVMYLSRYLQDGEVDSTFGVNGISTLDWYDGDCKALALLADGKIVTGGNGTDFSLVNNATDMLLTRHLPNGRLDTTFNHTGRLNYIDFPKSVFYCYAMSAQSDGKLLVAGAYGDIAFVLRFNINGTLDNTFGQQGLFQFACTTPFASSVLTFPDGRILFSGDTRWDNFVLARIKADGSSLDSTFGHNGIILTNPAGGTYNVLAATVIQPDGKILGIGEGSDNMTTVRYLADAPTAIGAAPAASPVRFTIFPNPTTTMATITSSTESIAGAELIAADGKVAKQFRFIPAQSVEIALQGIPTGLYTLRCHFFGTSQAAAQSLLIRNP